MTRSTKQDQRFRQGVWGGRLQWPTAALAVGAILLVATALPYSKAAGASAAAAARPTTDFAAVPAGTYLLDTRNSDLVF